MAETAPEAPAESVNPRHSCPGGAPLPSRVRVAVLGAGMSGICMGMSLKRRGIDDFVILEKAADVGGTWRENSYPGVACDVPSHVYSFSFELNPDWSHSYSGGPEIQAYCRRCAEKYGLLEKTCFGTEVTAVVWQGDHWRVGTAGGAELRAELVVSALGGLHLPRHAELPGLERFAGERFHTAEWNHRCNLAGKRVAIVGTGASAAQVLPAIAATVAEVTVFQRSAAWVFPRLARDIPETRRQNFRRHPWRMRLYRWLLWSLMDLIGVLSLRRGSLLSRRLKRVGLEHLEASVADPALRARLTPDYEPGCKRRVISDDYLATFNRDNVHLVTEPIVAVEPAGIRDGSGRLHAIDVLIEATGFRPFDITDYVDIRGRDGIALAEVWGEQITSHRTMMVPGFPNLFMLLGPNSGTGHTSALIMIETQVSYALDCLELMDRHDLVAIDPDPQVVARYNARLQRDMQRMVFSGGCNAWYTDDSDYNFTLWPYSAARFVFENHRPKPDEFRLTHAPGA